MTSCELNQIFVGEVASVQNYGAFVRIPGCKQQGLIHKTQVSTARVDEVADVLQRGDKVWCKVINVGEDGKIGLSMKHVNQGNGKDLDPNGVEQQMDEQRRKKMIPGQKKPIELEAVLNTTCTKCGTRGHLKQDCFMTPDGQKYDLLPEIEEAQEAPQSVDRVSKEEKKPKSKKLKKRKKSKKSRQRSDGSSDEEEEDDDDSGERKRKKGKKKRSRESKKRKRKHSDSSSDSDSSSSPASRETKGRRESSDKKSKKCKHSRSKHSD